MEDIINSYLPADDSFVVNIGSPDGKELDPSLVPIRISLPSPPPLELIEGYGLPPEEQYWRRPQMPHKLIQLEKNAKHELEIAFAKNKNDRVTGYKIIEKIWDEIENNIEYYKDELEWIKTQWWHRTHGYWFFNYGKPTYLCGWHYYYLTVWKIDGSFYPSYRDRDRRELLAWTYLKETKEYFKNLDDDGNPIMNQFGEFEMEESNFNVFYGLCEPKGRRQGVSNKAQCCQMEIISRKPSALGVIFSMTETSASDLFKDITVRAFRCIPFYFSPLWDGFYDQAGEIEFKRPKHIVVGDDLQSKISYAKSSFGREYDGKKIDMAVFDEPGKTAGIDILNRWSTHKRAMALGPNILGFSFHISTTEDLDIDGGKYFQQMVYSSNFYKRNAITGQTQTGLATIFFSSLDGHEHCIDKWGYSVVGKPTETQIKHGYKLKHGSRDLLQSERDDLLKSKNPKDQIEYRRTVVKHPFVLDECFQLTIGSTSVDIDIINKRNAELRRMREPFVKGNFEWENNVFGGKVVFLPSNEGRWEVSKQLNPGETNLKVLVEDFDEFNGIIKEVWMPKYPEKYTMGVDPFDFKGDKAMAVDTGGRMSDGGIAIYQERDLSTDPEDKSIYEWESARFVAVYRNRPLSHVFDEDVLKAAIYYGAMIYPETNKGNVWKYFTVTTNYDRYLLYEYDEATNKYKLKPGVFQLEKSKQDIWDSFRNHIAFRGHKECHSSLLNEIAALKSFEDLNRNDMAAAAGCALLGSKSRIRQRLESVDDVRKDLQWWLEMR